jgi:hypothetical protein
VQVLLLLLVVQLLPFLVLQRLVIMLLEDARQHG